MQSLVALLTEELEIPPPEQIARPGESRHPAPVLQPRIPADVIEVQMRAHHDVDVFGT